jgi:FkbM family methyltransferase
MGILAASAEGRARRMTFTWQGSPLPEARLGLTKRLQLLFRNLTGKSQVEGSMAFLQMMRHDELRQEIQQLSTRLSEAQAATRQILQTAREAQSRADGDTAHLRESIRQVVCEVAQARREATAGAQRLHESIGELAAEVAQAQGDSSADARRLEASVRDVATEVTRGQGALSADARRLEASVQDVATEVTRAHDSMTMDVQRLHQAIQAVGNEVAEAHSASMEGLAGVQQSSLATQVRLVEEISRESAEFGLGAMGAALEKLDAIGKDIRIRQEGLAAQQEALTTEHHRATDTLMRMLRPPVLAGKDEYVVRVGDFMLAIPLQDVALAARYAYWGAIDQGLSRCLTAILRPGMIFVDIGANVGLHTLEAARAVGRTGKVYSFEPTPRTVKVLRQNLDLNGISEVEVFPAAVMDRSGEAPFYLNSSSSSLNTLFPDDKTTESVRVAAVTLDEALQGRERVDVIKIDVEGAEPLVLRGMTDILRKNPRLTIIMEFAAAHLDRAGIPPLDHLRSLRDLGFRIRRIDDFTGDLLEWHDQELLAAESSNLHLEREHGHIDVS